jgi:hypothetical protein
MELHHLFAGPALGLYAVVCLFIVLKPWFSRLRAIPGPFLTRYTRLWLFKEAYFGTFPQTNVKLHQKYGTQNPS